MKFNEKNLCAFSKVPPFDLEGFLQKRGDVNKTWQKRYFVLKGNLLFYFERKTDKEPLGLIILEGCRIELSEEQDPQYCFEIIFGGNRTYTLSANDQKSMEFWMKTLACSSYEYKKALVEELRMQLKEIEIEKRRETNKLETKTQESVIPKAPPRRQNPFNRPAPPPPTPSSTFVSPVGEETATPGNQTENFNNQSEMWKKQQTNNSTINNKIIEDDLSSNSSNNALRYNWETFGEEPDNSFAAQHGRGGGISAISVIQKQRSTESNIHEDFTFRTNHEKFKKIILDDINDYKIRKENAVEPLIQF